MAGNIKIVFLLFADDVALLALTAQDLQYTMWHF